MLENVYFPDNVSFLHIIFRQYPDFFRQIDEALIVHGDQPIFAVLFHGNADGGFGKPHFIGNIDGAHKTEAILRTRMVSRYISPDSCNSISFHLFSAAFTAFNNHMYLILLQILKGCKQVEIPAMKIGQQHRKKKLRGCRSFFQSRHHSTVTDFAKFLGLSTSHPRARAA